MSPAIAGAAILADEVEPPTTALAGASCSQRTMSGSSAELAGPKNPSAQPYTAAMASRSPNDAVPVIKVDARTAATAMRTISDTARMRPRGKRSPASPPASVRSRATAL
jgi:hypothetical protein